MANYKSVTPAAAVIDQRKENQNTNAGLYFPSDIGHHAMILNFKEYAYGGSAHVATVGQDSIVLPLPKSLQDNLNVKVGSDELGILGSLTAEASGGALSISNLSDARSKLTNMFGKGVQAEEERLSDVGSIADGLQLAAESSLFLARAGLGSVAPDIAKGISAGAGTAINPYATLVFSGVDLKVHNFEWLLSPDTPAESETLQKIIKTIQRHITPEMQDVAGSGASGTLSRGLMRYPSMVDCFFHGIDHNYFYKLKTSMISQFNVDYAPNGIALNKGGRPSAVRLTMVMTEAAIHTKSDYQIPLNTNNSAVTPESTLVDENGNPVARASEGAVTEDKGAEGATITNPDQVSV
jgi:hypothetical protein